MGNSVCDFSAFKGLDLKKSRSSGAASYQKLSPPISHYVILPSSQVKKSWQGSEKSEEHIMMISLLDCGSSGRVVLLRKRCGGYLDFGLFVIEGGGRELLIRIERKSGFGMEGSGRGW